MFRALVLELFLEIFSGKMIKLFMLTAFYVSYESNEKAFLICFINNCPNMTHI